MNLIRIARRYPRAIFQSREIITLQNQIRCLYSGEELGIKKYEESRKVVEHAIANHSFFKQKLRKQLLNTEYSMTQLEYGLKNLLHIVGNDYHDISLLKDALRKLIIERRDYDGDKYRFDTILTRAFHYLNMPDEAIECFDDGTLGQLFKQVTSYQILLDLLYENGKYDDVLRIYEQLCSSGRLRRSKYIDVIVLATYYRLNTPEAFEKAYRLWKDISGQGSQIQFRKSRTFVAGLALKQNHPEVALEILEGETTYVSIRHIKLLAWAQQGEFEKVFQMLDKLLRQHEENPKTKPLTSISILTDIETLIKSKGSKQDITNFHRKRDRILSANLIMDKSLDDIICAPFPALPQANIYHKRT